MEGTHVIPKDLEIGCVRRDWGVAGMLRDDSRDYDHAFVLPHGHSSTCVTRTGQANVEVGDGVAPGS